MASPRVAASRQTVLSLRLKLNGTRVQVLADLDRLLALAEELTTVEIEGDLNFEFRPDAHDDTTPSEWPSYSNQLVRFAGRQASLTEQQGVVFEKLWSAHGEVVPQRELKELFPPEQDQKQQVHTIILRLRHILREAIPEIQVVTAGNGYHLSVALN